MSILRQIRERRHGAAVEAEFWKRVQARNAPRALPERVRLGGGRRRWPWVVGSVVAVAAGLLLPGDLLYPLALLAVGIGATIPTWGRS